MSKKMIIKLATATLVSTIAIAGIMPVVSAYTEAESENNGVTEAAGTAANQQLPVQEGSYETAAGGMQLQAVLPGANVTVETVADLVDTVNNAEMDKIITLGSSFPTALSAVINLNITHNFNITLNGAGKELTVTGTQRHFNVSSTGSGTVTFEAITFKGRATLDGNGMPTPANPGGGIVLKNSSGGAFAVKDCTFTLISGGAVKLDGVGRLSVEASTFASNTVSDGGGAIRSEEGSKVFSVTHSTFINNINTGAGYDGGAIFVKNASGTVNIEYSLFLNNSNTRNRGGAVAINFPTATSVTTISDCFFDGNSALSPTTNVNADGGALSLLDLAGGGKFTLNRSTFSNNKADDDGGAALLQAKNGSTVEVINSTFYKNSAYGKGNDAGASGGAIQAFASGTIFSTSTYTFTHNTFADNSSYSNAANQEQRGGAIAGSGSGTIVKGIFQNNITIGNKVYKFDGSEDTASKYQNVSMTTMTDNGGNVGLDNNKTLTATYEDVFGIYPVLPCHNKSEIQAGNPNDPSLQMIPTMPIIPNDGVSGIANKTGTVSAHLIDERQLSRNQTTPDSGAVEIGWIRYNSNGGEWTLPELTAYTGDEYYTGIHPTDYYDVGTYNEDTTIIDDSHLQHSSKTFVEWNTAADGSGTTYTPGTADSTGDGLTLYAIWEDPISYSVTYDGNGYTGGTVPLDATAYISGANATVLDGADLVRDGYSFSGWNTAADGSGTAYAAGDILNVTDNITLYAQWQPVGADTDNNDTTNNHSDAELPQTGSNNAELLALGLGAAIIAIAALRKKKQ